MIPVTKPFLPPREEFEEYLRGIWQRNWLTNNGPLVLDLEAALRDYLKVPHLLYVANGTIALQMAIKALGLKGEILTTPFSYVATTSSIVWEGCTPVFVDIDNSTFNIDPDRIEDTITPRTTAILATHCFGNACDIEAIGYIAKKHNLKVIYDGAHAFGTLFRQQSVFLYGNITTASFHATKLYHTVEGGAVVTQDPELHKRLAYMRNFGHDGPAKFNGVGINGKNSEFHAAMGHCNLKFIQSIMERRAAQWIYYENLLKQSDVQLQTIKSYCQHNYAYFPIVFPTEQMVSMAMKALEHKEIFTRRYFYPSLSQLDYVNHLPTPVSDSIARRILCLPLYHDLSPEEQDFIVKIIQQSQNL